VGDIVDLKIVPFGQAVVDLKPTRKELELDRNAKSSQHPLDSLAEVKPVAEKMEHAVKKFLAMKQLTEKELPPQVKFQCPSGFSQCAATGWEACLQHVAPHHQQYFPTFECIEARSCGESVKPPACVADPQEVVKRCVDNHGFHIDQAQLETCYEGNEMVSLLLNNDVQTLEAKPMWLPWFTVDGVDLVDTVAKSEAEEKDGDEALAATKLKEPFLLGKKVCDAFAKKSGKKAPEGCSSLPQSVADIPDDPYAKFKLQDFTSLIDKMKQEQLRAAEEAKKPWYLKVENVVVMAQIGVPVLSVAACATAHFIYKGRVAPQQEYSSLNT